MFWFGLHLILAAAVLGVAGVATPGLPFWMRIGLMVASIDLLATVCGKPLIKPGPLAKAGHPWLCNNDGLL